ncbi:MAG: ROK family protein [Acidobacteriaceae bacterium]|nr:ROK family protein [Acidobacteriaceae bacterium]
MRETNARAILSLLKKLGPCSRADLVRKTGMSAPTVANVISDLDERGLIEWMGEGTSSGGRRPDNLRFKAEHGCLAGVDVTADSLRVLLTDLNGERIEELVEALPKDARNPQGVVDALGVSLRALMQKNSLPWKKLLAMTVGVGGITNARDGVVISVGDSSVWRGVPLLEMLRKQFSCALFVENDSNLAAIGEHFNGVAQSEESFICILITAGSGVGAGIFVNGKIVHGSSWTAGEIGYLHVPNISSMQPALYEYGRLEQILSGPGILRSWNAVSAKSGVPGKIHKALNVLDLAMTGNSTAIKVVHQRARLLSDVVLNLSLTLNPSLFVFGGDLGSHPALLEPTIAMLRKNEVGTARVLPSNLGNSAVVWGALAVSMQEAEQHLYSYPAPHK